MTDRTETDQTGDDEPMGVTPFHEVIDRVVLDLLIIAAATAAFLTALWLTLGAVCA